jgi:hypothetical protein
MGKSPRSQILFCGTKKGKSPMVKLGFGNLTIGKRPNIYFYFEPLNNKRTQWAPKRGNILGVKFEFGRLPKRKMTPE